MFFYKSLFRLIFLSVVIIWGSSATFGQNNLVSKICAETNDKLQLKVWVAEPNILIGEDVVVNFEIKNNGNKEIFLVKKSTPEIFTDRDRIVIEVPLPFPIEKSQYDYSFEKIAIQETYRGQFTIPKEQIIEKGKLHILTGFGFVSDIEGINRELKPNEDPVGLRNTLALRMKTIALGEIEINVMKANQTSK